MTIPLAQFSFAQRVRISWHEVECGVTEGVITGINYDHRRSGNKPLYTITEDDGSQVDFIDEDMISSL